MDKITLALHRDGCAGPTGGYTLLIGQEDERGYGHGYRVFGPNICLRGRDQHLRTVELTERDAREIFTYIRPLLGDEWLAEQAAVEVERQLAEPSPEEATDA